MNITLQQAEKAIAAAQIDHEIAQTALAEFEQV